MSSKPKSNPTAAVIGRRGKEITPASAKRAQQRARDKAIAQGKPVPVFVGLSLIPVGDEGVSDDGPPRATSSSPRPIPAAAPPLTETFGPVPPSPHEVTCRRAALSPLPVPPDPAAAAYAGNENGLVERVCWNRSMNVGVAWTDAIPARVLRRAAQKIRIVYLRRRPGMVSAPDSDPDAWEAAETWVLPEHLRPRSDADAEARAPRAAYPEF